MLFVLHHWRRPFDDDHLTTTMTTMMTTMAMMTTTNHHTDSPSREQTDANKKKLSRQELFQEVFLDGLFRSFTRDCMAWHGMAWHAFQGTCNLHGCMIWWIESINQPFWDPKTTHKTQFGLVFDARSIDQLVEYGTICRFHAKLCDPIRSDLANQSILLVQRWYKTSTSTPQYLLF